MNKTTERQKRFVDYYIELGNIEQAALRAGYSENYARGRSHELLANVGVKAYLDERLQQLESERIASAAEVMKYLTAVMRGEHTEEVPVLCGDGCQALQDKEVGAKDRLKAAELLGKRYQMFTDKLAVEGSVPIVIRGYDDVRD